jgi:hypothetical protein
MDRSKANVPQAQVGFLDFLVVPMFKIWEPLLALPQDEFPAMTQLKANRDHWKRLADNSKDPLPSPNGDKDPKRASGNHQFDSKDREPSANKQQDMNLVSVRSTGR